jgi:hypothetical protein
MRKMMKGQNMATVIEDRPFAKIAVQLPNGQFVETSEYVMDYSTGQEMIVIKLGNAILNKPKHLSAAQGGEGRERRKTGRLVI